MGGGGQSFLKKSPVGCPRTTAHPRHPPPPETRVFLPLLPLVSGTRRQKRGCFCPFFPSSLLSPLSSLLPLSRLSPPPRPAAAEASLRLSYSTHHAVREVARQPSLRLSSPRPAA